MAATELAQYGEFVIQHSTASSFAAPTTIARVSQFNVNDSFNVLTVEDFDTVKATIADQILGTRTVSLTFNLNVVLSDAGWQAINTAYKAATYSYFRIKLVDTKTTATTGTLDLAGYYNDRSIQGQQPVATASIGFIASEILSDTLGG